MTFFIIILLFFLEKHHNYDVFYFIILLFLKTQVLFFLKYETPFRFLILQNTRIIFSLL